MFATKVYEIGLSLFFMLSALVDEHVFAQTLKPEIQSMHISSDIYFRFATTVVETKILNVNQEAAEIMFDMTLPDSAFITGFTMEIGGQRYAGNVKEKEKAKKQFEEAKSRGESAGHIAASPRTSNKFNILVNVEKNALVIFKLKYQELLKRSLGSYQHVIYVDPGQIVKDFKIKVFISESREIIDLTMPPLEGKNTTDVSKLAIIKHTSPKRIDITYAPSVEDQKAMSEQGISGQFKVKYDVTREKDAGDLLVVNGYFVHMFAPKDFKPLSKDVMFVLDRSGSMSGRKIIQLKEAMKLIMQDMKPEDRFNIVFFDQILDWLSKTDMLQGTKVNFGSADRFIDAITARGSTNINKALTDGIKLLNKYLNTQKSTILMFLTDGQPTSGETRPASILQNVKIANEAKIPIFSLGFGNNLDFDLLKQMSLQNNGFARRIYEDSDASLQIKGLYSEISSALLTNVTFSYVGDVNMNSLTKSHYKYYFGGSELIVAGQMISKGSTIIPSVKGWNNGYTDLLWKRRPVPELKAITKDADLSMITEKMWAYLTIKQLIKDIEGDITITKKDEIKAKIISLALKYQFVTPFTSMVVTAPQLRKSRPFRNISPSKASDKMLKIPDSSGLSKEQRSPNLFLHMKGSTVPLCMNLNPKDTGTYQFLYSPKKQQKSLHVIVAKTMNRKKKRDYIKAVRLRKGKESQFMDTKMIKISNGNRNSTKLWKTIKNKATAAFSQYNLTTVISPSRDPLFGLQLHLYIKQSNIVNATGPLRWFVGMNIKSIGLEIIVQPNVGKQITIRNYVLLSSTSVSSYITDSCWYIMNPEKEFPHLESLFQQKDVETWL
ncbi:inter-alpha-trypsin inhibitor heavy chain H3-like isoform X2 [Mytilus trossulus]|uniref:inter-alpha-trypsin inhibitor heavy chain H3-like isoform X2 n=1 Tax=Mytilus trossulus TaxID=6551 RepID=UPI0030071A8F